MPGLIDYGATITPKPFLPEGQLAQAGAKGYDPTLGVVNLETDTVSGQLDKILSKDSPVRQRLEGLANQESQARGLVNSSIGVEGVADKVLAGYALPIAQADAGTFSQQRLVNQEVGNVASQFGAGAVNQAALAGAAAENTIAAQQLQSRQNVELQQLKGTQATGLANIEAQYKQLMQASASASTVFAQSSKSITDILNDPNTTAAQKQAAVDKQMALLQQAMTITGAISNIDLAALLDFS